MQRNNANNVTKQCERENKTNAEYTLPLYGQWSASPLGWGGVDLLYSSPVHVQLST